MAALAVAVAAVAVVVAVVVAGVATHLAAHVHSLQTTIYWLQHLLCFAQAHPEWHLAPALLHVVQLLQLLFVHPHRRTPGPPTSESDRANCVASVAMSEQQWQRQQLAWQHTWTTLSLGSCPAANFSTNPLNRTSFGSIGGFGTPKYTFLTFLSRYPARVAIVYTVAPGCATTIAGIVGVSPLVLSRALFLNRTTKPIGRLRCPPDS